MYLCKKFCKHKNYKIIKCNKKEKYYSCKCMDCNTEFDLPKAINETYIIGARIKLK